MKDMRLWVTRPVCDAEALRSRLVAQGHEVIAEPLLSIDFKDAGVLELTDVQGLIATSRNAVRAGAAMQQANVMKRLPLFAVGPGTAAAAKSMGFQDVIEGPSTAQALLPIIQSHAVANGGALLHLAGEILAFDLADELRQIGYRIHQVTVYVARSARELSPMLLSRMTIGTIDGVILLSPRTAQIYMDLVEAYQVRETARHFAHFCLSQAVADRLSELQPCQIMIAQRPNVNDLLMLTGQTTAQC